MPKLIQPAYAPWPEAMATVTSCKYKVSTGRALAFGLPETRHFTITFNYWALNLEGAPELHTSEFLSEKAFAEGTLFPIRYNPEVPYQTTRTLDDARPTTHPILTRSTLLAIGIMGSIALSLAWLFLLRGC